MKKTIPVLPLPLEKAVKAAEKLLNIGDPLSNIFPSLGFELEQSGFEYEPREWVALAVFSGLFYLAKEGKISHPSVFT